MANYKVTIHQDKIDDLTVAELGLLQELGANNRPQWYITDLVQALDKVVTLEIDGAKVDTVGKVRKGDMENIYRDILSSLMEGFDPKNSAGG